MTSRRFPSLAIDRLAPEVLRAGVGELRLEVDLARLEQVARVDAPDAIVFYGARVLEVVASLAASAATGEATGNIFSNLVRLDEIGMIAAPRLILLNALRRLGNDVRHAHRAATTEEAEMAVCLLERALDWYFVRAPVGPRLTTIARASEAPLQGCALLEVVKTLEAGEPSSIRRAWVGSDGLVLRSPFFVSLVAERWIAMGGSHVADALAILDRGLERHEGDGRLRQLRGWALRLLGRVEESVAELEALMAEGEPDEETLGILAGTHKRRWAAAKRSEQTQGEARRALSQASELYARAWRRSKRRSTYAGINAATLALLNGDRASAREIAADVAMLYEARRGRLALGHGIAFAGYWDIVTLAEAELLLGEVERARRRYRDAFRRYADHATYVTSTRAQLELVLEATAIAPDAEAFLAEPPRPREPHPMTTYTPKPLDTRDVALPESLREAAERLAEHVHDTWAARRIEEGWRHGTSRDDVAKTHPDLVPYDQLPESEKEYDRASAAETLKALLKLGYRIER